MFQFLSATLLSATPSVVQVLQFFCFVSSAGRLRPVRPPLRQDLPEQSRCATSSPHPTQHEMVGLQVSACS
jgi:hypothetical protein